MEIRKLVLAAPVTLAICALAAQASAADKVTLMFDWLPSGLHGAWYAGKTNGCLAEQNLDISLERGFGGVDTVAKVASGVTDMGMADLGTVMLAGAREHAPVKALFPVYNESPMAVATMSNSGIKALKDLEGHKLASAPGDSTVTMLPLAMKDVGADFSKVERMSADVSALFGLLMQGKADAITTFMTTGNILRGIASASGKQLDLIHFGADLGIYGSVIFANKSFIESKPDVAARVVKAGKCVLEKAHANPEAAVDALMEAFPTKKRENEDAGAKAGLSLVFDNATYKEHGFSWDMAKVERTFERSLEAQGLSASGTGADYVVQQP